MSTTKLNPYLGFKDNARQAMEFYKGVFGGNLMVSTYKEGQMSQDPSQDNMIMHSQLDVDNGMTLMGADSSDGMTPNSSISLSGDNEAELRRYWDGLAQGATITQPLVQAPWGDTFGQLTDKFGVPWMVNIVGRK